MKIQNNLHRLQSSFIALQGSDWLEKQRVAGKALSEVMIILQDLVKNKTQLTLLQIDKLVEDELALRKCTPTFKNYKGFPGAVCVSVNRQLVHGIPSDTVLKDGDVVSFDFGATFEGAIADSATTMIYGDPVNDQHPKLLKTTKECLYNAIKAIKVGSRMGVIGYSIDRTAKHAGFSVIDKFGGHGIGWNKPHADLFISNKSNQEDGVIIQPGLVIAIEPLLVPHNCSTNPKIGEDGWTVYTEDIGSHEEHSLFVHEDHVEIMTWRPQEIDFIPQKVYFNQR